MPRRTLTTLLAILATTTATAALAGSAQAASTASLQRVVVDTDTFPDLLAHPEVDFTDGSVAFQWSNASVSHRLTGTLHIVDGDDACYRTRTDSFDATGSLVATAYDKEAGHCRRSDAATAIPVDVQAAGGPSVRRVQVLLEKQRPNLTWDAKATSALTYLSTFADDVTILAGGIDAGGESWANGAPTDAATVSWAIGTDGSLTATYRGHLHLKSFVGGAGRVVIRAINPLTGFVLATTEGDSHSPVDNSLHSYADTLAVTSSSGANLQVAIQSYVYDIDTDTYSWGDVDTQTVSVGE